MELLGDRRNDEDNFEELHLTLTFLVIVSTEKVLPGINLGNKRSLTGTNLKSTKTQNKPKHQKMSTRKKTHLFR